MREQDEAAALPASDFALLPFADVPSAETGIWGSRSQLCQSLQWLLHNAESASPARPVKPVKRQALAPSAAYALPTFVSSSALDGCCFEDCSGRRVVYVREGGDATVVVANRHVPLVLTSYYFEVRPRTF